MDWAALVKHMEAAGFSPGEAIVIALVVAQTVRLKLRTDALAKDRMRMWEVFMRHIAELDVRMSKHEEEHHGSPTPAAPAVDH